MATDLTHFQEADWGRGNQIVAETFWQLLKQTKIVALI